MVIEVKRLPKIQVLEIEPKAPICFRNHRGGFSGNLIGKPDIASVISIDLAFSPVETELIATRPIKTINSQFSKKIKTRASEKSV